MYSDNAKKVIRTFLELHQEVMMAGGMQQDSPKIQKFRKYQRLSLRMINLPVFEAHTKYLFEYPLSQAFDITIILDESTCRHCAKEMLEFFDNQIKCNTVNGKRFGETWGIEEQVEFVYNSLVDAKEIWLKGLWGD